MKLEYMIILGAWQLFEWWLGQTSLIKSGSTPSLLLDVSRILFSILKKLFIKGK